MTFSNGATIFGRKIMIEEKRYEKCLNTERQIKTFPTKISLKIGESNVSDSLC